MQNEHRPRRSRFTCGLRRFRNTIRVAFRPTGGPDAADAGLVIRGGVVMGKYVAMHQDGDREKYANRIQMMHERHPVQLEDARAAVATANEALMVTTSRLSDARGGPRVDYRNANREYRAARRALIVAEMQVKHIEKTGEDLPTVPKPRISVQPYEVVRIEPQSNVAYPAVQSSARRMQTLVRTREDIFAGDPDVAQRRDVATRGVIAAEARSAVRLAKMVAPAVVAA